jgi:phospholipase C
VKQVFPCFSFPTVADLLPAKGLSWRFYGSKLPPLVGQVWSMFDAVTQVRNSPLWDSHVLDAGQFDDDARAGNLPNVTWLVPQDQNSEHPPFNICSGENWTVARIDAVMQSPLWNRVAIVFTYDDFGGWYDHVPPPVQTGCNPSQPYGYGFRLPALLISPYAKQGYVMKGVAHQASIARFIETIFGLPSLNSLDPAAQDGPDTNDLLDAIDFSQAPQPPIALEQRNCLGQR